MTWNILMEYYATVKECPYAEEQWVKT